MAAIELHLSHDRDPAEFHGGETIEGSLDMYVQDRCECRGVTVHVGWESKSQYEADEGAQPALTLTSGVFEPGHRESHRFALELARPIWSYSGQTFSLSYSVKAKADLMSIGDAHAEAPIIVRPAEGITESEIPPSLGATLQQVEIPIPPFSNEQSISAEKLASRFQPGCLIASGIFSILFSLPFLLAALFMYSQVPTLPRDAGLSPALPLVAWAVLGVGIPLISGLVMVYRGMRPFMARWILGDVLVDLPERLVRPGQTINCRVKVQPKRGVEIQGVRLILRARETVWRRTKNSRRATHQIIRSDERALEGTRSVRAGDYVELSGRVDVPAEGPYSLSTPNHSVEWHVVVHVALRGWIDQYSEHLVTVVPIGPAKEDEA